MITLRTSGIIVLVLGLSVSSMLAMASTNGGTGIEKRSTRQSQTNARLTENFKDCEKDVLVMIKHDNARALKKLIIMYKNGGLEHGFRKFIRNSFVYALTHGSVECVRVLLPYASRDDKNGPLNQKGQQALLLVAKQGNEDLVDALLSYDGPNGNIDVSVFDQDHFTALHHVAGRILDEAMSVFNTEKFSKFDESIHEDSVLGIMQKIIAEDPTLIYKENNDGNNVLDILKLYAKSCRDKAAVLPDAIDAQKWEAIAKAYDRLHEKIEKFA